MDEPDQDKIKKHFDSIGDYDTSCRKVVPYNDFIQKLVYLNSIKYLSLGQAESPRVLDLGIGTAFGASLFLAFKPNAKLIGVDFSQNMLEKARKNILSAGLSERVELIYADFANWEFPLEQFDFCFSTIAIHNIPNSAKLTLFGKIYASLKEGGFFINGDFIRSESAIAQKAWEDYYSGFMKKNLSGPELDVWLRHAFTEDTPAKISDQQDYLKHVGFSDFGVMWQKKNLAVYFARK